ncbi:hypothetical protein DPEC_G00332510 [Dallia pectoralis]|uniref:Uncharacterized protein n=1 Tax=Dallia pectoralis TaxID=75939 RepID=A0ACC2F648_DALPE|nr:hypothetical protein DPEC_G00332510 [Dallia pectoralis]
MDGIHRPASNGREGGLDSATSLLDSLMEEDETLNVSLPNPAHQQSHADLNKMPLPATATKEIQVQLHAQFQPSKEGALDTGQKRGHWGRHLRALEV